MFYFFKHPPPDYSNPPNYCYIEPFPTSPIILTPPPRLFGTREYVYITGIVTLMSSTLASTFCCDHHCYHHNDQATILFTKGYTVLIKVLDVLPEPVISFLIVFWSSCSFYQSFLSLRPMNAFRSEDLMTLIWFSFMTLLMIAEGL